MHVLHIRSFHHLSSGRGPSWEEKILQNFSWVLSTESFWWEICEIWSKLVFQICLVCAHVCLCVCLLDVCVFHFSVLNRVLEPSIIMEMTLSNGTTKAFEVRPKILMRVMLDKWINSMISSALWLLSLKRFLFWNFPWLLSVKKSSYFATLGGCFT